MFPIAYNAEALKLLALRIDMLQCEFLTLLAELLIADLMAIQTKRGNRLTLNRQAVRIPARNIRCLVTGHILIADDKVLEDLIEGVTQMQITVCIRRAIMQNKQGLALVFLHQCIINMILFPLRQKLRLALGKTRAHREISLGKMDCLVVVLRH